MIPLTYYEKQKNLLPNPNPISKSHANPLHQPPNPIPTDPCKIPQVPA